MIYLYGWQVCKYIPNPRHSLNLFYIGFLASSNCRLKYNPINRCYLCVNNPKGIQQSHPLRLKAYRNRNTLRELLLTYFVAYYNHPFCSPQFLNMSRTRYCLVKQRTLHINKVKKIGKQSFNSVQIFALGISVDTVVLAGGAGNVFGSVSDVSCFAKFYESWLSGCVCCGWLSDVVWLTALKFRIRKYAEWWWHVRRNHSRRKVYMENAMKRHRQNQVIFLFN